MPTGSLADIRIVDLSQNIAGPYCTKLLAGLGAEVIKIEPPGVGDPMRHQPPFAGDVPGPERSGFFFHLNTGKKSVALDVKSAQGKAHFLRLVRSADIVVESFAPGVMAELGLGFEELRKETSGIILTSISNFGQHGPYRDYLGTEIVFMALSGFMYTVGDPDREPVKLCGEQSHYQAGLHAAIGSLAALRHREETGDGQWVDVSITEAIAFLGPRADPSAPGPVPQRPAGSRPGGGLTAYTTLPCKDGYIMVRPKHRTPDAIAKLMGEPRLAAPELLEAPFDHADEIDSLMHPWLLARTKMELLKAAQDQAIPWGAVLNVEEVLNDPQHAARGYFATVEHPELGEVKITDAPMRLSETPWVTARPPLLGEHTNKILSSSEARRADPGEAKRESPAKKKTLEATSNLPLSNIRVLDLTQILAGPTATQILADFGAEVIKIESHTRPDRLGGNINVLHRNKLGLCLNLTTASGKKVFKRLVQDADVVIDNFSPRVMGNLGLDYPVLSKINPSIVQVSMPAYGSTGPYRDFGSTGPGIEAMSGIQQINGYADRHPRTTDPSFTDQTTALNTVIAILAALRWRRRSGKGQRAEVVMREVLTPLIGEFIMDYSLNGRLPARWGNRSPMWAPQGCYSCSGDDSWVVISVRSDEEWRKLCLIIGRPDLAEDARYATVDGRQQNHDKLDQIIEAWTSQRGHQEAMEALQSAGIPAGAVLDLREMLHDPQMQARGHFEPGPNPEGGQTLYKMLGFRLPAAPVTIRRAPCNFGEHTQIILRDLVGLSAAEIAGLYQDGTIADAPVPALPARSGA